VFVQELRNLVVNGLDERHRAMLTEADARLFELSRKAPLSKQKVYFDAMRLVQLEHQRLATAFVSAVAERCSQPRGQPVQASGELKLSLKDSAEVEDSISVTGMAVRAEAAYGTLLHDLNQRLDRFSQIMPGRLPSGCLSPWNFCEAFRDALNQLKVEAAIKFPLSRLFERSVLMELEPLYAEAVSLFDRHGLHALRTPPRPARAPTGSTRPAASAPLLDAVTTSILQRFAEGRPPRLADGDAAPGYRFLPDFAPSITDAHLAEDLMRVARGDPLPDFGAEQVKAMRQRALLVGRMFNEIVADPQFPPELARVTEAFRFPAIKAALADPGFFTQPSHPVRGLVNDMAMMAAATRIGGRESVIRFEGWAQRILRQCDPAAEAVREKAKQGAPLPQDQIERFLRQQATLAEERRQGLITKVRESIDQELALNTLSCEIPPPVEPLLHSGWAPMMARHVLREGADSAPYRAGMELLHRVLFALNPDSPNARTPAERAALRKDLAESLATFGMTPPRIESLLGGLDQALDTFKSRDVPGQGAAAAAPAAATPKRPAAAPPPQPPAAALTPPKKKPAKAPLGALAAPRPVAAPPAALPAPAQAPAPPVQKATPPPLAKAAHPVAPAAPPAAVPAVPEVPAVPDITARAATTVAQGAAATVQAPIALPAAPLPPPAATIVEVATAPPAEAPVLPATPPAVIATAPSPVEMAAVATATPDPLPPKVEEPAVAAAEVVSLPLELPTPQRLLEQLLKVGSWFRVYDRATLGTRWLKLLSWFPQVQRASFGEFDGANVVTLHAREFFEDLMLGRSEPIDIPPQTVMVLQALRERYANGEGADPGNASSMVA